MVMAFSPYSKFPVILAISCALSPQPVMAAASHWEETDGGRLRIVTEPWQAGMTTLRGALQIELEPGWKTYWREPGSAGIPPQVAVAGEAAQVAIHFPVPNWVDDDYGSWAGYKHPVTLPLTFTLAKDNSSRDISADVFLGICKEICIPVAAHFEVPLTVSTGSSLQTMQVDAAFAALPGGNSEALSIGVPSWTEEGKLEVSLAHRGGAGEAQLFLSAGAEHQFRKPVAVSEDGTTTVFRADPLFDPGKDSDVEMIVAARRGDDTAETTLRMPAPF